MKNPGELCPIRGYGLIASSLGLAAEAGKVSDLIKKGIFHRQGIEGEGFRRKILFGLGGVLWYLTQLGKSQGLTFDEIAEANIEKLRQRYPDGYTPEASAARVDTNPASEPKGFTALSDLLHPVLSSLDPANHTPECLAAGKEYERLRHEYSAQWPGHCRECLGTGGSESEDTETGGIDREFCLHCIERPKGSIRTRSCPRCKSWLSAETAEELQNDIAPCPGCGWQWRDSSPIAQVPECTCLLGDKEP